MEDQSEETDSLQVILCNLLLGGIFPSAFVANVLVLLVFYRKSGLRSVANRFVVNLMIINLVSCASLLPLSLADNAIGSSHKILCMATELSSVFCSSVIIYSVLLIAMDQYFAVVDPLHYHRVISSSKSYSMIVSSWCLSAIFTVVDGVQPSLDDGEYSVLRHCGFRSTNATREHSERSYRNAVFRFAFCTMYSISVFAIPFVLICFIYYRICVAASGNTKRTRTSCVSTEESCKENAEKSDYFALANELQKQQLETSSLLSEHPNNPSFVLTRPSPPRAASEGDSASVAESGKEEDKAETPFLKPTLKNNASFSKFSSLHIQFSSMTEEIADERSGRRHSNASMPILNGEFDGISKSRSPSIQSNAIEMCHGINSQMRSSMSSSINSGSTAARHPASRASSIRSTSSYIVHNIRHRISNASLFRYREDARAARISAMVIVMALLCWLPFFAVFYLHSGIGLRTGSGRTLPVYLDSFSVAFLLLSTVVSPFLFAFRNRKIKKEIRKILSFRGNDLGTDCAKSFYKYNFSLDLKSQKILGPNNKPDPITY